MSESKSRRGESFKREKEKTLTPSELLELSGGAGDIQIDRLDEGQQYELLNWFERAAYNRSDDEMVEETKLELLEQFSGVSIISDLSVADIAKTMGREPRKRLGIYIEAVLETGTYPLSFYECWNALDQASTQKFMKRYSEEQPEHMVMVAPFVNPHSLQVPGFDNWKQSEVLADEAVARFRASRKRTVGKPKEVAIDAGGKKDLPLRKLAHQQTKIPDKVEIVDVENKTEVEPKIVSAFDRFFERDIGKFQDFMEPLVEYLERNPKSQSKRSKDFIIDLQKSHHGIFLLPYVKRLMSIGVLSGQESFIEGFTPEHFGYEQTVRYTAEDQQEIEEILTADPKTNEDEVRELFESSNQAAHVNLHETQSLESAKAIREIDDRVRLRDGKFAIDAILGMDLSPSDRIDFIVGAVRNGAPVFSFIEELGLNVEEVSDVIKITKNDDYHVFPALVDLSDLKALIAFAETNDPSGKLKNDIAAHLSSSGVLGARADIFILEFEEMSKLIPEEKFDVFQKNLLAQPISVWAHRLDLVGPNGLVDAQTMLSAQHMPPFRLAFYGSELMAAAKRGELGDVSEDDLRTLFKDRVQEGGPMHFFFNDRLDWRALMSVEESQTIIAERILTDADHFLVGMVLRSSKRDVYKEELRTVLMTNDGVFRESYVENKFVAELLGPEQVFERTLACMPKCRLDFLKKGGVHKIAFSKEGLARINERATQLDAPGILVELREVAKTLGTPSWSWKKWDTNRRSIENSLGTPSRRIAYLSEKRRLSIDEKTAMSNYLFVVQSIESRLRLHLSTEPPKGIVLEHSDAIRKDLNESIVKHCNDRPGFVFERNVAEMGDLAYLPFIARDLSTEAKKDPSVLVGYLIDSMVREGWRARRQDTEMLDSQRDGLVRKYVNYFAFDRPEYEGDTLHQSLWAVSSKLAEVNPAMKMHIEFGDKPITDGYYATMLRELSTKSFYGLYKTELEKKARSERAEHGVQMKFFDVKLNMRFEDLSKRISLLDAYKPLVPFRDELAALPPEDRERYINTFVYASEFSIGAESPIRNHARNIHELHEMIFRYSVEHVILPYDFDVAPSAEMREIDFESLKDFQTYYSSKSANSKDGVQDAIADVVREVTAGEYVVMRHWRTHDDLDGAGKDKALSDLKERGVIPPAMNLDQYETWIGDLETDIEEALAYEAGDYQQSVHDVFSEAVADEHVPSEFFSGEESEFRRELDELNQNLRRYTSEQKELSAKMAANKKAKRLGTQVVPLTEQESSRYNELRSLIREESQLNKTEKQTLVAKMYLKAFAGISGSDIQAQAVSLLVGKKVVSFKKAFKTIIDAFDLEYPLFTNDVRRIQLILSEAKRELYGEGARFSKRQLTLTDKFDLSTHLKIGEKPAPSCQSYNDGAFNGGLLSYIADPNVRMLQIWDSGGQIVSRSVLRLLQKDDGSPALFMERVYSTNAHDKIPSLLASLAKQKADAMGVDLILSSEVSAVVPHGSESNKIKLSSKGSMTPYVYTDVGGGLVENGIYSVTGNKK
jgi:hypothetical protein